MSAAKWQEGASNCCTLVSPSSVEFIHCKKLEVDLTQENVISVALWIHLGPGSGPSLVGMVKGYTIPFPSQGF